MIENSNNSTNASLDLGFNFDIVIAKIEVTNVNVEETSKLLTEIKFNNNNIKITSSRINVTEFKPGRNFEFTERLSVLKDKLLGNPLECQVYYDGLSIGTCNFQWPDGFVNCIGAGYGRELTRCCEADIQKDNQKVGRMEILVRLQVKCHEFDEKLILQPELNHAVNAINSNDVMFVVGESKYGTIGCSDVEIMPGSESRTSGIAPCLDLSDFRHIHGKTIPNADILDSIGVKYCETRIKIDKNSSSQLKQNTKHLLDKEHEPPSCSNGRHELHQLPSEPQIKQLACISESRFTSCSSTDSNQQFHCVSDENVSMDKKIGRKEKPMKRYCAICNENVSWLPKFAACPKCGFRPILYNIEEKPYDHTLTADKILQEYVTCNGNESSMKKRRCTCKNGKICVHCRIRKQCEDVLQATKKDEENCSECETKSSDMYNICKTSSHNCRPYLTKVFQELRGLFDMNEAAQKKNIQIRSEPNNISKSYEAVHRSDFQVNQPKDENKSRKEMQKSRQSHEKNVDEERKQFVKKNFQKHESCKSKIFDNNKQPKHTGRAIGHKSCLAGLRIVPRNMGWLWNTEINGLPTGWMPGAIRKPIKNLMRHFLNEEELISSCDWQIYKNGNKIQNGEKDYTKESTLHICKKEGVYYITLRPLKAIVTGKECTQSCMNMKPIQFRITKNPFLIELRKIKQNLKKMGFAKCTCHKPISNCCCRDLLEKNRLEYQCCKECYKREMPNCVNNLILSDTTDSEAEFEFGVTPPAGVVQSNTCFKKRKKVSSATQYDADDFEIKEEHSKPLKKYFKLHNCAVGNKFGKAFGPYGATGYNPGAVAIPGIYGPGGVMLMDMQGKSGAKTNRGPGIFKGPDGKFNMAQYLAYKALFKPSPEEIAERKRQKKELLRGVNPPILCEVKRRGKPINMCSPCLPTQCNVACLSRDCIC